MAWPVQLTICSLTWFLPMVTILLPNSTPIVWVAPSLTKYTIKKSDGGGWLQIWLLEGKLRRHVLFHLLVPVPVPAWRIIRPLHCHPELVFVRMSCDQLKPWELYLHLFSTNWWSKHDLFTPHSVIKRNYAKPLAILFFVDCFAYAAYVRLLVFVAPRVISIHDVFTFGLTCALFLCVVFSFFF